MKDFYQKILIKDGNRHTSISKEEAEFLGEFVKKNKLKKTLEIGLAFGVSTAYIMQATERIHYAIDPFQASEKYQNTGLKNIKRLGFKSNLKFFNDFSAVILPKLWQKEITFDFAFVDGSHYFDDIFVDFYYLDKIMKINGFIIMHDAWTPQVKTLISWIRTNKKNFKLLKNRQADNMAIWQKISTDKRKWFEFEKFEVSDEGTISCYM